MRVESSVRRLSSACDVVSSGTSPKLWGLIRYGLVELFVTATFARHPSGPTASRPTRNTNCPAAYRSTQPRSTSLGFAGGASVGR